MPAIQGKELCVCHSPRDSQPHECPICIDKIDDSKDSISLKCGSRKHVFHKECLRSWLQQDKESCPTCREPIARKVITDLDPEHFMRQAQSLLTPQTIELNVPGVARFLIPRPMGVSTHDTLMRIAIAATQALSALEV
jgi:hypothetical protein